MSMLHKVLALRFNPIRTLEWVVAVCTAVGGLYLLTPLYDIAVDEHGLTPFAHALASTTMIATWGAFILVGALLVMLGLLMDQPRLKSWGWFAIILARLFQILTTWLAVGLLPIIWIYPFTVMLVIGVLYVVAKLEVYHDKSR